MERPPSSCACQPRRGRRVDRLRASPAEEGGLWSQDTASGPAARATIVLLAAREGGPNARMAAQTRMRVDTVRTWRGRLAAGVLSTLSDRPRSLRFRSPKSRWGPASYPPRPGPHCHAGRARNRPARWSPGPSHRPCRPPPCAAGSRPTRASPDSTGPGSSSVARTSRPRHPACADLYARTFVGEPLGEEECVISSDEKTTTQARCRCHPTLASGQAWAMRVNHEYGRGGALAYLAAYDVHRAPRSSAAANPRPASSPS